MGGKMQLISIDDLQPGNYYYLKPKGFSWAFWVWIIFVIVGGIDVTWLLFSIIKF